MSFINLNLGTLRRLLALLVLIVCLPGCLNGKLEWASLGDATRSGSNSLGENGGNNDGSQIVTDDSKSGGEEDDGGETEEGGGATSFGSPTITAVVPNVASWRGGFPITISGSGFQPGLSVYVGNFPCTNPVVSLDGQNIICTAPQVSPDQWQDLLVTNPDNTSTMVSERYIGKVYVYTTATNNIHVMNQKGNGELTDNRLAVPADVAFPGGEITQYGHHRVLLNLAMESESNNYFVRAYRIEAAGSLARIAHFPVGERVQGMCTSENDVYLTHTAVDGMGTLSRYKVSPTGTVTSPLSIASGNGSSQCVVANNKFVYVMNNTSQKISQFDIQSSNLFRIGTNNEIDVQGTGRMAVSPDGKFLVVSMPFQIGIYRISPSTGSLEIVTTPMVPSHSYQDVTFLPGTNVFYLADDYGAGNTYSIYTYSLGPAGELAQLGQINASPGIRRLAISPFQNFLLSTSVSTNELTSYTLAAQIPSVVSGSMPFLDPPGPIFIY